MPCDYCRAWGQIEKSEASGSNPELTRFWSQTEFKANVGFLSTRNCFPTVPSNYSCQLRSLFRKALTDCSTLNEFDQATEPELHLQPIHSNNPPFFQLAMN
jgi:hypothetical protein